MQNAPLVPTGQLVVKEGIEQVDRLTRRIGHRVSQPKLESYVVQEVAIQQTIQAVFRDVQTASTRERVREKAVVSVPHHIGDGTHTSCLSSRGDRRLGAVSVAVISSSDKVVTAAALPDFRALRLRGWAVLLLCQVEARCRRLQVESRLTWRASHRPLPFGALGSLRTPLLRCFSSLGSRRGAL